MSKKMMVFLFVISFIAVCFLHYALLELRYVYYNKPDDYQFLRQGHALFLMVISLMVIFFPSRILAVIVVPISLLFPPVLRQSAFPEHDAAILIGTGIVTFLFLAIMIWRQRLGTHSMTD